MWRICGPKRGIGVLKADFPRNRSRFGIFSVEVVLPKYRHKRSNVFALLDEDFPECGLIRHHGVRTLRRMETSILSFPILTKRDLPESYQVPDRLPVTSMPCDVITMLSISMFANVQGPATPPLSNAPL